MKTLSKRKKLQILRKMLAILRRANWHFDDGLCWALDAAYKELYGSWNSGFWGWNVALTDLGIRRPKCRGTYWWTTDRAGYNKRIVALLAAIKRLTVKKKKVK